MNIYSFYASKISPWLRRTEFGERLDIALVAFNANLQFSNSIYTKSGGKIYSGSELMDIFPELDPESMKAIRFFMRNQFISRENGLLIHPKYFYTEEEKSEYRKYRKELKAAAKYYHLPCHKIGPESLYYHHGLRFAPDYIKRNISGKLFADVGGYLGDSALVFAEYAPEKILIFEPDQVYHEKLEKNIRKFLMKESYDLHPFALSDKRMQTESFECRTLDEVSLNYTAPFGLLKADIEGMGLKFLLGAKKVIERDRPLLTIAVYHCEEELFGISKLLKEWDLHYHIEFKSLRPMTQLGELVLFAYPEEWKCEK